MQDPESAAKEHQYAAHFIKNKALVLGFLSLLLLYTLPSLALFLLPLLTSTMPLVRILLVVRGLLPGVAVDQCAPAQL
jgi:hypothetical protein